MLIIGQLRDLRNNKGSRDLTAVSLQIPVSGVKRNVSNLVFSHCMSDRLVKVQDTPRSLLHETLRRRLRANDTAYLVYGEHSTLY